MPVPKDVALKDPKDFRYIGKPAHRLDGYAKSHGAAIYTQDIELPGMLTAVVAHPERFGAKVKSFVDTKARAVKGAQAVVPFAPTATSGVAVIARNFWSARKGREALTVEWDDSAALKTSSTEMFADYRALAAKEGPRARWTGDPEAALARAARTFEATYEF